ncbi:hypothetical protein AN958_10605 [Leucoagaricus sp. SymC.cos]|nr:hypothetical protein AN958_10605 [Leucoagaricus sp. SymC.cos]
MFTPPLPVELFHEILKSLRDDLHTLKQCALACSTLRYIVQQHLFSEMTISRFCLRRWEGPVPGGLSLVDNRVDNLWEEEETRCSWLLKPEHSHLLAHVRHLKLQCYPGPTPQSSIWGHQLPDPSFLSVLDLIPAENLDKVTIMRRYRDDPLSDTESVVTRLLKRCNVLSALYVEDRRVSAAHLIAVAGSIKVLRVFGTEFVEDPGDVVGADTGFVTWMIVGGSGSGTEGGVFPRLKNIFLGDECRDVEVVNEVLEMCKPTLRSFVYTPFCYNFSSYPNPCLNQNGAVIEFTVPSSIRILAINCPVMLKPASRTYPSPLEWLTHTLRRLSRNQPCSRLEIIHIKFLTTEQIERLDALFPGGFPIDLCFREFDKLLSNKARFPKLKKVYLTVGRHYLKLFRDPETLPLLKLRGLLGLVYEEVSSKRFWLCAGPGVGVGGMESVQNLPWDGRACEFM